MEFVLVDVLRESAHLLYADAGVRGEFDPDGADLGLGVWVGFGGYGGVFGEHGVGGSEGCVHFLPAGWGVSLVVDRQRGFKEHRGWGTDSGAPLGSA